MASTSGAKRSRMTRKTRSPSSWRAARGAASVNQEVHVGPELLLQPPLPDRADDEPPAFPGPEPLQDAAQAVPLAGVVDPPRDPDVVHLGHVDEVPPGEADEGGDAGPLGAQALLGHLDQDLLALAEGILDGDDGPALPLRRRSFGGGLVALPGLPLVQLGFLLGQHLPLVLAEVGDEVPGVQEGVLLEADVDEGRLHAGQDVRHHPLVDVPDDGPMAAALQVEVGQDPLVDDGDTGLADAGIDDDLTSHRWVAPAE
jgi:hypothetical protein